MKESCDTSMKAKEIRDRISEITTQITFSYNGKNCGVDPMSSTEFDIWYGDTLIQVNSVDEVMSTSIFDSKTLSDIIDDIVELEM